MKHNTNLQDCILLWNFQFDFAAGATRGVDAEQAAGCAQRPAGKRYDRPN